MQFMPAPLLDRMEVIELPGYTSEEKLRIAMLHLIPRVLEQHGITDEHIDIPEVGHLIPEPCPLFICWWFQWLMWWWVGRRRWRL
jgi:hypothetical protein